jgi:class 3 adenylate cyclase
MEQLAYEEAAELLERALELLELGAGPDPLRRMQLRMALTEAQITSGDFAAAKETLERVMEAAREGDDDDAFVQAVLQLSRMTEVGYADERLIGLVEEALPFAGEGDTPDRAALISTLSTEILWIDAARARELALEALEIARRTGDGTTLAICLHRAIIMELHPSGSSEQRIRLIDELADVAERAGAAEFSLRARAFRIRELLELAEITRVDREIEAYAKAAGELRMPQHLWHVPLFHAMRALMKGELESAERLAEEALAGGTRAGEPLAAQFYGVQAALLRRMQGRVDELLPVMRQMTERYPALPAWRTALASALAQLGKVEEARLEFERIAAGDFEVIPQDGQFYSALALVSEVCVAVGDAERAALIYEWMLPVEGKLIVIARAAVSQGPYDRLLGLLAAARGEREQSKRHFENAIGIAERAGDRPMAAWTRVDYASMLLGVIAAAAGNEREPAAADRERALALLSEAIETGREITAPGLVDRALSMRLEAQGLSGVDITTSIDDVISAVESERPDLRAHAAPDGTVTILFSDIEDSTVLTERLGDESWLDLLRHHNTIFRQRISSHDGYEVKNQGDGFMLAFPDPLRALECAIAVQRDFAALAAEGDENALRVRMGLHKGEVIAEDGDFFGKNVILAARIAAKALGGEILVSSSLKEACTETAEAELSFDEGRELELKGLAGTHKVFRTDWDAQAATA